ncbi:iron ABC transporter permease [Nesterenkonia sp. CL21]|uniref:FecCD family ABC transporter permease n=1 Tax=Nesterenkonia sp. CL21 TaxID=3064894 RepID=UPI00287A703E|nr:iron ABC transporter permease [Nesterenkonia sp. CL21]MDS2173287.1 iron ABC transporter permease [Nesterenkonia sp. CL21]
MTQRPPMLSADLRRGPAPSADAGPAPSAEVPSVEAASAVAPAAATGEYVENHALSSTGRRVAATRRWVLRFQRLIVALLLGGIVAIVLLSVSTGPISLSMSDAGRLILGHLIPGMPWMSDGTYTGLEDQAVWHFRLPRVLLALIGGAGLALAGALMQAVVRNPLAEPYLLGVSSGAGLGAVAVISFGSAALGGLSISLAAFVGALAATGAVFLCARQDGVVVPTRLILAGVALGSLLSAVTSFLTLTGDAHQVFSVMFFLLGSLSAASFGQLVLPTIVLVGVLVFAALNARGLNALMAGDETATALGVNVHALRLGSLALAALLTASVVAVCGGIGFVGLIIPHTARLLVGSDHRLMLPVAVLGGALFLAAADLAARTAAAPTEVPIGIFTAAVGAPFFLWLLRPGRTRGGLAGLLRRRQVVDA